MKKLASIFLALAIAGCSYGEVAATTGYVQRVVGTLRTNLTDSINVVSGQVGSTQASLETHTNNLDQHVTADQKIVWGSGIVSNSNRINIVTGQVGLAQQDIQALQSKQIYQVFEATNIWWTLEGTNLVRHVEIKNNYDGFKLTLAPDFQAHTLEAPPIYEIYGVGTTNIGNWFYSFDSTVGNDAVGYLNAANICSWKIASDGTIYPYEVMGHIGQGTGTITPYQWTETITNSVAYPVDIARTLDATGITQSLTQIQTQLSIHTGNADIHVTAANKQSWDAKIGQGDAVTFGSVTSAVYTVCTTNSATVTKRCHFKFNDNAANTDILDSTGNHNATATTATESLSTLGQINSAIDFNAAYASATIPYSAELNLNVQPWTISVWIYMTYESGNARTIISQQDGYNFYINSNGWPNMYTGIDNHIVPVTGTGWRHYVITCDGNGKYCFYINAVKYSLAFENTLDNGNQYYVGLDSRLPGTASTLDDLRIYNGEITQAEVDYLYNSGNGTEGDLPIRQTGTVVQGTMTITSDKMSFDRGLQIGGSVELLPSGAPTNPQTGTIYYNSSDNHFYGYNGSAWVQLDN